MVHVHVSALEFFVTAAYIIVFGFLWRSLAARWSERPVGQAMAYIF